MSAIFGICSFNGEAVNSEYMHIMQKALFHYGKDAQDIYVTDKLALGCCLNKISTYSQYENPIYIDSKEQMILISDAQIYNREELVNEYKLTDNINISTNELLMAAYKKWGEECPKYLNGDFTFALWKEDRLVLVRDHLGVRPLYYYYNKGMLVFATDYRAILALPCISKKLDDKSMYNLLINNINISVDDTYFEGIKKLRPAHILCFKQLEIASRKYWTPGQGKKVTYDKEETYIKTLYEVVIQAVKIRLHHITAEIGAEISGGLDSAVIDILANRELKKEQKELSFLFSWSPSFEAFKKQERDERNFIEEICKQESLHCMYFDSSSLNKQLDRENMEFPSEGKNSPIRQALSKANEKGIRCMLSGWGGDQGISHRAGLYELFMNGYWGHYIKEVAYLSKGSTVKFVKIVISSVFMQLFRPHNLLHRQNYMDTIANTSFNKNYKKYRKKPLLYFGSHPIKHLESGNIQTRTELTAWVGADYNIQYLFPFLDYHVVDFAMQVPNYMYYKLGINRYIYRKAFEELLPKDLCYYMPKDDIARSTYNLNSINYANEAYSIQKKIQRNLFNKYIDFNKVEATSSNENKESSKLKNMMIFKQLSVCCNLQKLVENVVSKE